MSLKDDSYNLAAYVAIALSLVVAALYVAAHPLKSTIDPKWFEFSAMTFGVFLVIINTYWDLAKSGKFWCYLCLLLVAHVMLFAVVLRWYPQAWPFGAKCLLFIAEAVVLGCALAVQLGTPARRRRSKRT